MIISKNRRTQNGLMERGEVVRLIKPIFDSVQANFRGKFLKKFL